MTDPAIARTFLESEIEALEPFDFVAVRPATEPLHVLEVTSGPAGGFEVRVPGRPASLPELSARVRRGLLDRGFVSTDASDATEPWKHATSDPGAAADLVFRVLTEVFEEKASVPLDVSHGSHRAAYEAEQKLEAARARIEAALAPMVVGALEKDSDGDYVLAIDHIHVVISPRALPGGPVAVRVFAVTNLGVQSAAELGLFLARLNFGLVFGRLALDAEHGSVWIDETLLGDQFSDEELNFAIRVVSSLAHEWAPRIKERFGGETFQDVLAQHAEQELPPTKPGHGLYL